MLLDAVHAGSVEPTAHLRVCRQVTPFAVGNDEDLLHDVLDVRTRAGETLHAQVRTRKDIADADTILRWDPRVIVRAL